jgi:hypothetical protein
MKAMTEPPSLETRLRTFPPEPKRHCWLRFRRHVRGERIGLHKLYKYFYCTECGWPMGMERIPETWAATDQEEA